MKIAQDCQDQIFSTYQAIHGTSTLAAMSLSQDQHQSDIPRDEQNRDTLGNGQTSIVEILERRSPPASPPTHPRRVVAEVTSEVLGGDTPFDFGYISDPSIWDPGNPTHWDMAYLEAIMTGVQYHQPPPETTQQMQDTWISSAIHQSLSTEGASDVIMAGSSQHQQLPKPPQNLLPLGPELHTHHNFSFQEARAAHREEEYKFLGMSTSDRNRDRNQRRPSSTDPEGLDLEKWKASRGEETEQKALWSELMNGQ